MKIAIVYDRVSKWGGAERVLLALHELFPKAPLFTSIYNPKKAQWVKIFPEIKTSFLQNIPFVRHHHELIPFLMPIAFEQFNFREFDLVISVTSEAAKGILTDPNTKHICYCLTPTRYLWSGENYYFENKILKFLATPLIKYLKAWDRVAANRPDKIIAISSEVQERIEKYYKRESQIIFPPVSHVENLNLRTSWPDLQFSLHANKNKNQDKYFLVVSRLVNYKKIDLVIKTFNTLPQEKLVIVGVGSEEYNLKKLASAPASTRGESDGNIKFTGFVSEEKLADYYRNCQALIFPQEEDFGIVAVEAQSFGKPVIAYKKGGILDIKAQVYFEEQSVESLTKAIATFHKMKFNATLLAQNAKRFSKEKFKKEFLKIIK